MEERTIVRFENLSPKGAAEAARTLAEALRVVEGVSVERARDNDESLDIGTTLVLVLGTPSIIALAHGISKWATRTNQGTIIIEHGRTVVTNVNSKDAAAIIAALNK
jgi:serine/threonine protein phosphatase PrpC